MIVGGAPLFAGCYDSIGRFLRERRSMEDQERTQDREQQRYQRSRERVRDLRRFYTHTIFVVANLAHRIQHSLSESRPTASAWTRCTEMFGMFSTQGCASIEDRAASNIWPL